MSSFKFGKKIDIARARTDGEAVKLIAEYIRYMQEEIERGFRAVCAEADKNGEEE